MTMRQIIITENDSGQRLDKFLTKKFKNMPTSLMYKYIRTKYIKLNGKRCGVNDCRHAESDNGDTDGGFVKPFSAVAHTRAGSYPC